MEKQRKLELIKEFTESLNEIKAECLKEVGSSYESTYDDFRINVIQYAYLYVEHIDFTDDEKADFNKDYTLSGDLRIILEIVLGQMWVEW
jgi:hypothetical protein